MLAAARLVPFRRLCLQDEESHINDEQDAKIAELKTLLAECNDIFLGNLNFTIDNLNHLLIEQESAISVITDFIGNRQCECCNR